MGRIGFGARTIAATLGFAATVALGGCASARVSDTETTRLFRGGDYEGAAERLRKGLAEEGEGSRDELLYLMDLGLSLHAAGKYDESNQAFLKADKIAEIKDYTSLATEGATLLTGENIKGYKGEDFEKVLINTYLSMNYALMGDLENALVEARRVNRKLHLMVTEGERKYKQNAFARYLSAMIYEAEGDWNDAYVDYKETLKLEPGFPGLGLDLWRVAGQLGMRDEQERWDEELGLTAADHKAAKLASPRSGKGEIIVLYENGISPVKRPHPSFYQIPKFYPRYNPVPYARVEASRLVAPPAGDAGPTAAPATGAAPIAAADTAVLHSVERTAVENLDEKYGGIIAKKIAGVLAKEVVADQIGRRTDPLIGAVAKLIFYVSDQADCRSWNLLPKDLQVARIAVEPGTYSVRATPAGAGAALPERTVQVGAGKKVFVNFRYMP